MKECKAFQMSDANKALEHIKNNFKEIKKYDLYQFDDGYRSFGICEECKTYILIQLNEYHSFADEDDSYYKDYFPVNNEEEVKELNKKYGNKSLENVINRKSIVVTNGDVCFRDRRRQFYIDIRNRAEREEFINKILDNEFMQLQNYNFESFEEAKESIINLIFPISIDLEKWIVDCIKNTTCAAAAITDKSRFLTPEEALERIKVEIEIWNNYKEEVIQSLITGSYKYSEKEARELVENEELEIQEEFFLKGETPTKCAMEIGDSCGQLK